MNYLFPNKYKKWGWTLFVPFSILGLFTQIVEYQPEILNIKVPALLTSDWTSDKMKIFLWEENNVVNEICAVFTILGGLLVAFSREKVEDEYIAKIRLESLVWAVFANYAILLFAILFMYDYTFFWVMIVNMFTVLLFFIIRFNWQLGKLKKSGQYEE